MRRMAIMLFFVALTITSLWPASPKSIDKYHYEICNMNEKSMGSGSGFPIDVEGNKYILTALHVAIESQMGFISIKHHEKYCPADVLYGDYEKDLLILEPWDDIITDTVKMSQFVHIDQFDKLYSIGNSLHGKIRICSDGCASELQDRYKIGLMITAYPGFSGAGIYKYSMGDYYLVGMMQRYYVRFPNIWEGANRLAISEFIKDFSEWKKQKS